MPSTSRKDGSQLSTRERVTIAVLALIAIGFGVWLALWPTLVATHVHNGTGEIVTSTYAPKESDEISVLFVAAGLFLLWWSINGLRLVRISIGGLSAEAREVAAARESAPQAEAAEEVSIPEERSTEPEPDAAAKGKVYINNETEYVYSLEGVPRFVLEDLLKHWPPSLEKPSDFGEFEFASRRRGKGNFPWLIKFAGLPIIRISYGGYGKQEATVAATDS